jgi:hypothetical protein
MTVNVICGRDLPFYEPWNGNGFGYNSWTFTNNNQGNWVYNTGMGSPAPCSDFQWNPVKINYGYGLETPVLNAGPWTCAKIYLDFDYKLVDRNMTSAEKLTIETFYNGLWHQKDEFVNTGSVDWTSKHYEISSVKGKAFKVRFMAHGANSSDILHWYVDNINIYGVCNPPTDLQAVQSHNNTTLTWTAPNCGGGGTIMQFIFDDGTAESGWRINPGYTAWMGNEFPISASYSGVIQSFDVSFMDNGTGTTLPLSIDVFDGTQALVGSSAQFQAVKDIFINVPVNDIPFNGMFYAMVKWDMLTGNSYYLGFDTDGPYAAQDLEWYYDGTAFQKLSDPGVAGSAPGVFLLRATALVNGDLKSVTLVPGQKPKANPTPATNVATIHQFMDTHNYATMGQLDNQADSTILLGYNVYRTDMNGSVFFKKTANPITATTYVDQINTADYGTYKYYVTDVFKKTEDGQILCESSSDTVVIDYPHVGINEPGSNGITIYPNPAFDVVNVTSTDNITAIEVLNFIGQTVYNNHAIDSRKAQVNVSVFNSGVYFMKVTTTQGTRTMKVTVAH